MTTSTAPLTKKDFASDVDVKWCPGCGDYAILSAVQSTLPELGIPKEQIVFVSGIGCSSRFPHYLSTYGFHTIHGRAPAVATGLKLANPELSVWVITGDGDGLSIGASHLAHLLRRNVGLKVLLFNNNIYGLTKGQYSPTSQTGTKTKSTPYGSLDNAFQPLTYALGSGATFVARSTDKDPKHLQAMFKRAADHQGTALIEILQNCVIFNDGVHNSVTTPATKQLNQLVLEHGKPLRFGTEAEPKGIRINPQTAALEVVSLNGPDAVSESALLVHDEQNPNPAVPLLLSQLAEPTALGVLRCLPTESYESQVHEQISAVQAAKPNPDLQAQIASRETWTIKG